MTDTTFNDYKDLMAKLLNCVKKLRLLEEEIVRAASNDNTTAIDDLVRKSQPDLLEFRGLEQKRSKLENELGIAGKHFREVLLSLPVEQEEVLDPILTELTLELNRFKDARDSGDRIMKVKLADVNQALADNHIIPEDRFRDQLV